MSDTDDTDYLLLIPPDFFIVNLSECESPNFDSSFGKDSGIETAVNYLANRVEDLYDRLSVMENVSPGRLDDFRDKYYQEPSTPNHNVFLDKKAVEKCCNTWPLKMDDFQTSLHDRFKNSDFFKTSTPNLANKNSTHKPTSEMHKQLNDSVCTENGTCTSSKFNLYQVDKLLSEMEKTRSEIKNKLQSNKKQISLMKNHFSIKPDDSEKKFVSPNETISRLEDRLKNNDKDINSVSSSSPSSQMKVNELLSFPRQPKNMLSISKVLSDMNNVETLQQKLEAETLKRKHCEELIQQLQLTLLEQEQNLTVALRVDAEKEEFIERLQNGWAQLVDHWKELENQRQELASMLEHERNEARKAASSSTQKIEELENRLHETYNLVTEYEEKNKDLEKSFKDLQQSLDNIKNEFENKLTVVEQNATRFERENLEISEQYDHVNENLLNEKQKCLTLESRISDLEKLASSLTREKQDLLDKFQEEKKTSNALKTEVVKLKLNCSLASSAEVATTKEINKLKQDTVKIKNNLREYYQKQLNNVLKDKVEEFQRQIQNAEKIMHQELHKQEKLASEKFQNEIIKLQNTHKIELSEERRINLKHVNILKSELRESRKKIQDLEERLKSESSPVKRVQSTIENQWMDALSSMIGDRSKNLRSPISNEKYVMTEDTSYNEDNLSEIDKTTVDLRRYVEMLLEKQPGKPTDSNHFRSASSQNMDDLNTPQNGRKPPWK